MTVSSTDLAAVGELIGWAARPKESPARSNSYRDIVNRYLEDAAFAQACQRTASGMGLTLHVDREVGVLARAYQESPLRMPMSDFGKRAASGQRKVLAGMALLGIARCAYPDPTHLDDELRAPRVNVSGIVAYLDRACEQLDKAAEDEVAGQEDTTQPWRDWIDLKPARVDARNETMSTRTGLVKRMCVFLETQGMLTEVTEADGGTFRATPRFRVAVRDLAENSAFYHALAGLPDEQAGEDPPAAPTTPGEDGEPS